MSKNKGQTARVRILVLLFLSYTLHLTPYTYIFAQEPFAYNEQAKRNPFIPLVTSDGRLLDLDKQEAKGELTVEGIIYDKQGQSFAIVNGSVLGVGDFVDNYQVLKIEEGRVFFIKDGQITQVRIEKEEE